MDGPGFGAIARAAFLYFAVVFGLGFVLGPIRILVLEPRIGETWATACEAPLLLAGSYLAARWITHGPGGVGMRLAVGALALALLLVAEIVLGALLRGATLADFIARFATPPGWIYGAALLAFAAMPALARSR